jgi:MEMO1 family protein
METHALRHPAVAGRFYPRDADDLRTEVRTYLSQLPANQASGKAIGCLAPHAGYMYSGHVAGAVFARVEIPRRCIVLCPNHTGLGRALAIMSDGAWETPLGEVMIDTQLAAALKQRFPALQEDSAAHRAEHAAEVELPFLQLRQPELRFVPIALGTGQLEPLEQLGKALADVLAAEKDPILVVASSDMNHYESDAVTRVKDHRAIERILSLDRADRRHAHCSAATRREVGGISKVCDFGRCLRRSRPGGGIRRDRSRIAEPIHPENSYKTYKTPIKPGIRPSTCVTFAGQCLRLTYPHNLLGESVFYG